MDMVPLETLKLPDTGLDTRLKTLLDAPAELLLVERLLLYSLVRGLRPSRCLEIGTHFGGAAVVLSGGLDDGSGGRLICVDPKPQVPPEIWAGLSHNTTLIASPSPAALAEASALAGGRFDFAFIDGDHQREAVVQDIEGVLAVAAPGCHLVFHDAHFWKVAAGIDDCLARHAGRLFDVGMISSLATPPEVGRDGKTRIWGGLRMLRVAPTAEPTGEPR
jgi:predicted O-methyltransferase YrrM